MDTAFWWLPAALWLVFGLVLCLRARPIKHIRQVRARLYTYEARVRMVQGMQPLLFKLCVQHTFEHNNVLFLMPHPWSRDSVQQFVDNQCAYLPFYVEVLSLDEITAPPQPLHNTTRDA